MYLLLCITQSVYLLLCTTVGVPPIVVSPSVYLLLRIAVRIPLTVSVSLSPDLSVAFLRAAFQSVDHIIGTAGRV